MKKLVVAGAAVILVVAGALLALLRPLHHRVPPGAFTRIRVEGGMTRAEVEAILGGPPGDYRSRQGAKAGLPRFVPTPTEVEEVWRWDNGHAYVIFTPAGFVAEASFFEPGPTATATGWLERLKERILGQEEDEFERFLREMKSR